MKVQSPIDRTFEQLDVGDHASLTRTAGLDDIPFHVAPPGDNSTWSDLSAIQVARPSVDHSLWVSALVSAALGSYLPGPGTIWREQNIRFLRSVAAGDTITAMVRVVEKTADHRKVKLETICTNQRRERVLEGTATVMAPPRGMARVSRPLPKLVPLPTSRYDRFIAEARELPAVSAGIVHPCSKAAILAALEVRDEGLLMPLLIGPEAKIRAAAEEAGATLDGMAIENTEHSHAAAARAVELAVSGQVSLLVKGSLHTDELVAAVVSRHSGLRTERRISHIYAMDVPAYGKPLMITDAAINILPTLEQKRDICQNAVDLLHLLGMAIPKVAVLAAVETVNPAMPATLDAAALTVMAARGQITGAVVDGPLAFDNAISPEAALVKGITSPVAGQADVLLVPDLEAGNMLAKQLIYFAGATAAGLVLGARVPIVLTSRSDPLSARIASAALAKLAVVRKTEQGRV